MGVQLLIKNNFNSTKYW